MAANVEFLEPLGQAGDRKMTEPKIVEDTGRSRELALATVHDDEIGQGPFLAIDRVLVNADR